jgi:hypothetical protein
MDCFPGFLMAGFEGAEHRMRDGSRVDLAAETAHDRFFEMDYARVRVRGIRTVRESARWHAVEAQPWQYDFRAIRQVARAARNLGLQVIWTLLDRDWPDDLDPFRPAFVRRFASFGRAFAKALREEGEEAPIVAPINEITTLAWLGGEVARVAPFREERGFELQCQLARAAGAAAEAVRAVSPEAQICCIEPLIHVAPQWNRPHDVDLAMTINGRRFRTIDMLIGRMWPQLGGDGSLLDLVGVTFYPESEWYYNGPKFPGRAIPCGGLGWRPLRDMLNEFARRYARPLFIAGTGEDGAHGPSWLRYVGREVRAAMFADVRVLGLCLNPILDCRRAAGERRGTMGLWSMSDTPGHRSVNHSLAEEIGLQQACFERLSESLAARFGDRAGDSLLRQT